MTIWLARLIDTHAAMIAELQRDMRDMQKQIEVLRRRRPPIKPPMIDKGVVVQLGIGLTALALAVAGKTETAQSVLGMLGK
jgi:hypothetical protein